MNRPFATWLALAALALAPFSYAGTARDGAGPDQPTAPKPTPDSEVGAPDESEQVGDPRTYLGVATSAIPSSLRRHLDLAVGFGIQIQEVMPESPAAGAGLAPHDILVRFGDQRLISPEHLSLLVQSARPDETIPLALIRKGREIEIAVTLGEAYIANFRPGPREILPPDGALPPGSGEDEAEGAAAPRWREYLRRQQDLWRRRLEQQQAKRSTTELPLDDPSEGTGKSEKAPPGTAAPFPLTVFGSRGVVEIDNAEGEVTIAIEDDRYRIEILGPDGESVYQGEFDPEAGAKELPEAARRRLEKMRIGDLHRLVPRTAEGIERTSGAGRSDPETDSNSF